MFTNCPECGTVYRIGAAELRVADGFVRCGNCSATFNALLSLADEAPSLATLEEVVRPPVPAPDAPAPASPGRLPDGPKSPEPASPEQGFQENPPWEPALPADVADDADVDAFADALDDISIGDEADADGEGTTEPGLAAADALEFDVPEDSWSRFFEDTGIQPARGFMLPGGPARAPGEADGFADHDDDPDLEDDPEAGADPVYVIDGPDPAIPAGPAVDEEPLPRETAATTIDQPEDPQESVPSPAPDPGTDDTIEEEDEELAGETASPPEPAVVEDGVEMPGIADGPAETPMPGTEPGSDAGPAEPEWVHQPMAWMPERTSDDRRRSTAYALGSALLAVLLVGQILHHERDELAASPAWGGPIRKFYGLLGLPLYPAWNLGAYAVRATEAEAGRTAGALDIHARIAVTGNAPVGLPLVRVVLRDRFQNILGSRVLGPGEYLVGDSRGSGQLVAPGATVPVSVSLVDPGTEVNGYEVDVCVQTRATGLQCQQDLDPFKH